MKSRSYKGKIKRTPVPKDKKRSLVLKWRLMRKSELKRKINNRVYTRYKNNYFIELISDAINKFYWTEYEKNRLKSLRKILEEDYDIPINFFCSYIYFATYHYMSWKKRSLNYKNYIGFISNEQILTEFANYVSSRPLSWRKKNSRWPEDFTDRWGLKPSIKTQKLGKRDKVVKDDLMSDNMQRKINRYL